MQSPVTVGQSVPVTMVGSDRDGNPIEFAPDFGDGTPVVYGPAVPERGGAYAVNHAWSKPGTYGVRIHSRDIFGAESTWSPTFFVQVLPSDQRETYALVDPTQGRWHFFEGDQESGSIYYGNPGDYPILGDWDCDGLETPGMYRQSDG